MFHCLVIKVCCVCLSDSSFILSYSQLLVKNFFLIFLKCLIFRKIKTEKEGFEPSRRVNDLLPFQGSPFGQLGYFSKLPYLLSSSDIYLCRSQRQVILYLVCFMLSSTFLTFLKVFILYLASGESGIRTHAPLRTNGFQDRLVMTTSISLHIMFFNIFYAVLSAHVVFYHQISPLSITNLIFFSKNWTYSFNFCYMSIFTRFFTLFYSLFYSLFSFKNASATTRSSGVVILILR